MRETEKNSDSACRDPPPDMSSKSPAGKASSNWLALRGKIAPSSSRSKKHRADKQQQKTVSGSRSPSPRASSSADFIRGYASASTTIGPEGSSGSSKATMSEFSRTALQYLKDLEPGRGNSLDEMRELVLGQNQAAQSSSSSKTYVTPYLSSECRFI